MSIKKAFLVSFNTQSYTATVKIAGSQKVYLEEVAVARNIGAVEMLSGRKAAVLFFDEHNPKEALVIAVY